MPGGFAGVLVCVGGAFSPAFLCSETAQMMHARDFTSAGAARLGALSSVLLRLASTFTLWNSRWRLRGRAQAISLSVSLFRVVDGRHVVQAPFYTLSSSRVGINSVSFSIGRG